MKARRMPAGMDRAVNMKFLPCFLMLAFAPPCFPDLSAESAEPGAVDALDIAPVWAAHPVGFSLLTHPPYQFVAFYDAERRLTVARRKLAERRWEFKRLPVTTGWDSHNYVTMAIDDGGFLHLSGDMHCTPLKYFRSTAPLDPATLVRVPSMVGPGEDRTTYPKFLRGAGREFVFTYRDGSSGNGNQIFNVYDQTSQTWSRLMDEPLTDGEGLRNAYFEGPIEGPDGFFHLAWVWRETPDAATNHDLSYARSKDLRHWESAAGKPLKLPMKLGPETIVDAVPVDGGMINGGKRIGFDHRGRVTISYHKHDAAGHTQPWTARLEEGVWRFHQITDWPWRLEFGGGGSLNIGIRIGPVMREDDGRLTQTWKHPKFGGGIWLLEPDTLAVAGGVESRARTPGLGRIEGKFPGLRVRTAADSGRCDRPGRHYQLRWETLDANRDRPRNGPLPEPSMLRLHKVDHWNETAP
jgi:hypothetical protein